MESLEANSTIVRERATDLVGLIVRDIADRGLRAGDRYLTTAEAARHFHVRRATANKAMSMLAGRGVLIRRLRSGTFVGRQAVTGAVVKTLFIVESVDRLLNYPPLYQTIGLIRERLPSVSVHLSAVPLHGALDYACDLMRFARAGGNSVGFLLISCPREVYSYFAESDVPTVVLSDVYAESESLTTMSGDQQSAGAQLANYLLQAGHRRIALLSHERWLAGDNLFLKGIMQALEAAGMPHGSLVVRSLSSNLDEFARDAVQFWTAEGRPTGVICRTRAQADSLASAIRELGEGSVPEITFGVATGPQPTNCPFTYAVEQDMSQQISRAIEMLTAMGNRESVRGQHVRLPIELVMPHRARGSASR